ncbi:hypothetical protein I6A60_15540 [Frankia sp. AgB1.9]|nr:hypothetical protein [Frankia sp. AgW1.1]MBL7549287.1 hypothetical protein [Frankia sp. AgB1.9]MBL7619245.1 hypothetical protein [Frankia sp. AgB1.8]
MAAPHGGVGGLVLVSAVLLGILLMHGGLGIHTGAGMMMKPASGAPGSRGAVGMARPAAMPEQGMARLPAFPTGLPAALRAFAGCDGHVGEMCLGVLRSLALLAGLTVLLLSTVRRCGEATGRPSAVGHNPPSHPPRANAPLLSSLCVLRL